MNRAAAVASILILLSSGCASFRPGWVHENSFTVVEGEAMPGTFDENGNYIPENPDIEWTYKIPDISSGMVFDVETLDLSPSIQLELFEFDSHIPYLGTFKIDIGVAYQRGYVYVGKLITNIFEISIGAVAGWNWEDNEFFYGPAFTIIKF